MSDRATGSANAYRFRPLWALLAVIWSMFRPALRFLAALCVLISVIALVADVTRWQLGVDGPLFASFAQHCQEIIPGTLRLIEQRVSARLHPLVWDPLLVSIIAVPTWMFFALLGSFILYAVRERREVNVFIN